MLSLSSFSKLPEIQTKQSLNNIRYLSHDGKFTYFQQNGKLYLSSNYSHDEIYSSEKSSSYIIIGSLKRKKLIIEKESQFHRNLDMKKKRELFITSFGSKKLEKVGEGYALSINQDDNWINFYDYNNKMIVARRLDKSQKEVKVRLKNSVNPFFIPQAYMPSVDIMFYTDINEEGFMALMAYSFYDKSFSTIYKSKFKGMNLKFCLNEKTAFVGEFSYNSIDKGSSIFSIPLYENKGFQKISQIYTSQLNDIGNLVCTKDDLFFIKTLNENNQLNMKRTEVAKLNIKTNKIIIITSLSFVTNIISMDGNILIPFRDKYYVAKGKSRLNDDKLTKE